MDITTLRSVDDLIELLAAGAESHEPATGGEAVDLLAHALQCAHQLSISHPGDAELQAAGLVHDIGHQLVPGDDARHGIAGGLAVRSLLGDRVARLVEYHVPAKRYLVTVDPHHRTILSAVSVRTLSAQGGPMSPDEVAVHRSLPDWESGVALRVADDAAKQPGLDVPGLARWRPLLDRLAAAR